MQLQASCNSQLGQTPPLWMFTGSPLLAALTTDPSYAQDYTSADCAHYFGLTWWSVWLQFTTLVAATALLYWHPSKAYTVSTMYFFIMSSVLMFFMADKYNDL